MNNTSIIGMRNVWTAATTANVGDYHLQFTVGGFAGSEWADWGSFKSLADAKIEAVKNGKEGRTFRVMFDGAVVWFA